MNIDIPVTGTADSIPLEVKFYTPADIMNMTGWSENTVLKLFNDPKFPASDFGRNKIIEADALRRYFSTRHEKTKDRYWRNKK